MKQAIYNTNQYLIERYPNVWNTKLVWMLSAALLVHVLFFVFGLFAFLDPESLQERGAEYVFFSNGLVYLSVIISILLIVFWLVFLFKNNAFKSFYPTTRYQFFLQFFYYLLILFSCSTFYLSYSYGIKTYISTAYIEADVNKEIEIANDAAVFLSEKITDYTLDKRLYPKSFQLPYCETNEQLIDESKPYVSFLDEKYQFYSLSTKESAHNQAYLNQDYAGYVFRKTKDSLVTYYYKHSVISPPSEIKTAAPSYYNHATTFYKSVNDTLSDEGYEINYTLLQ